MHKYSFNSAFRLADYLTFYFEMQSIEIVKPVGWSSLDDWHNRRCISSLPVQAIRCFLSTSNFEFLVNQFN